MFPIVWIPQPTPPHVIERTFPPAGSPESRAGLAICGNHFLSRPLTTACVKFRELLYLKAFSAYGAQGLSPEEAWLFRFRYHEVEHELLDYPYRAFQSSTDALSYPPIPPIEDVVRIASLCYMDYYFIVSPPGSGHTRPMIQHLHNAVEKCFPLSGVTGQYSMNGIPDWFINILAWACFVGAQGSFLQTEKQWFLAHVREISLLKRWYEWHDVENTLLDHFYIPCLQQALWSRMWADAMNGSVCFSDLGYPYAYG